MNLPMDGHKIVQNSRGCTYFENILWGLTVLFFGLKIPRVFWFNQHNFEEKKLTKERTEKFFYKDVRTKLGLKHKSNTFLRNPVHFHGKFTIYDKN